MITEQELIKIKEAVQVIKNGGIVVYPTETAYGLGVDATNPEALDKLYKLKGMPFTKPTHIAVLNIEEASKYVVVDTRARALAKIFLPGPLTLVLPSRSILPIILCNKDDNSLGVRIPNHKVAQKLLELVGVPITATSANKHGSPTTYSLNEIKQSFGNDFSKIDCVLDAGELPHATPSTLVSLMTLKPKILRQGQISLGEIMKVLNQILR